MMCQQNHCEALKRSSGRVNLAILAGCAFYLGLIYYSPSKGGIGYDHNNMRSRVDDDFGEEYKELIMPEWLSKAAEHDGLVNEAPDWVEARLKAAMVAAISESSLPRSPSLEFSNYTVEDLVAISRMYNTHFGILMYDPQNDDFLLLINGGMGAASSTVQLIARFNNIVLLLRYSFPERFQGNESDELAIAIGSGDCPHIHRSCLLNFPHAVDSAPCNVDAKDRAPVLQFSSVYRNTKILPHMLAMPMLVPYMYCFVEWAASGRVCTQLKMESNFDMSGSTSFEDLTNQVVWRGSNFGYLKPISPPGNTLRSVIGEIESKFEPEMGEDEKKLIALGVVTQLIEENVLSPRWKGVALTAVATHDAEKAMEDGSTLSTLPWVNMKFSRPSSAATHSAVEGYTKLAEYGIGAIGEQMSLQDLAQYKYHIDLGGGGGTTWTGTFQKLAMPGLLFHHVTPTKDYIHDWMTPWIHYVPVAADLRDLREKYEWAESHPQAAKLIAEQGTEFMRHLTTPEGFEEHYQKAFSEPVRRVIEAYVPASSSWREVLRTFEGSNIHQIKRCTGRSYCSRYPDKSRIP